MPTQNTIPVYKPLLEYAEKQAAVAALDPGWLGMGGYVADFEEKLRSLVEAGERHVVVLSTGHAALHLGRILAEVGPASKALYKSQHEFDLEDLRGARARGGGARLMRAQRNLFNPGALRLRSSVLPFAAGSPLG